MTKLINIYDIYGCITDTVELPEEVEWVEARVSVGSSGIYYKGAGTLYTHHYSLSEPQCTITGIYTLPGGIRVINAFLRGKYGIFSFPYTPVFTEFVGGCGLREEDIVVNSQAFDRSDVQVLNKIDVTIANHAIYAVNYLSARRKFQDDPVSSNLLDLMYYMLESDWNCPWNKNSISDVTPNGTITDVADLFRSNDFVHKTGTVYSFVSSLYRNNFVGYQELKKAVGHRVSFTDLGVMDSILQGITDDCVVLTVSILAKKYPVLIELPLTRKCIRDFALDYIVSGRNYGYGEKIEWGEIIKKNFTDRLLAVGVD